MQGLKTASIFLYYVSYPLILITRCLLYILYILATPFIFIWNIVQQLATLPWTIFIRYEPVWYYIGSAVTIGFVFALTLHLVMRGAVMVFGLNRQKVPTSIPPRGHSASSYRAARNAKRQKELERQQDLAIQAKLLASQPLLQETVREARQRPLNATLATPVVTSTTSRSALLRQTILEHTDEEDDDSVF